jgi:hypothetical protein
MRLLGLWADSTSAHRRIGKVFPLYERGKVCATVDVNQLLKNTSDRSRLLRRQADRRDVARMRITPLRKANEIATEFRTGLLSGQGMARPILTHKSV